MKGKCEEICSKDIEFVCLKIALQEWGQNGCGFCRGRGQWELIACAPSLQRWSVTLVQPNRWSQSDAVFTLVEDAPK